jgi:cellulose synthase (UDP-forming)
MKKDKPSIIVAFIVLLFISAVSYVVARVIFLYYASYRPIEKVLAIALMGAEAFAIFHAFGYVMAVARKNLPSSSGEIKRVPLKDFPPVAILMAARHEPKDILEKTLICFYNLDYPNKNIYFLDDSSDEKYKREAEELAGRYGVKLFRRKERHGAKAGVINDCLKTLDEKYVAVFDADQNPVPEFLKTIVSILEADQRLAYVQTPQFYTNMYESRIAYAANSQQTVFYEYICEGKSSAQAMICCGTNVIFRKEALVEVGGLDESSVTEDFATSVRFHQKKWRSLYYNHVNTFGAGPESLSAFFKQQSRWAQGNIEVLKKVLWKLVTGPFSLRPSQWLEYIITGSYYFMGLAYLVLMICPIMYLLFELPSFFMNPAVYLLTFLPYIFLTIGIFYVSMGKKFYSPKQLLAGQFIGFLSIPVYIKSVVMALLGIKKAFAITPKAGQQTVSYWVLWPQLLFWLVNYAVFVWGLTKFYYSKNVAVLINAFWVFYHFIFFSSLFYFNARKRTAVK